MKKFLVLVALLVVMLTSGCYWQYGVGSSEVGIQLDDGISISRVVGPGRYGSRGWFAEMRTVDCTIKNVTWNDPSLVTSDKQPIGLTLGLSYRRVCTTESISQFYQSYQAELFDDGALQSLVFTRVPDVAKGASNQYTIDQLISRTGVDQVIYDDLRKELDRLNIELVTVQIQDVAVDPNYLAKLSEKAQVIVQRDIAAEQVRTAEENLKKEKAQTEIELELARRQNLVNEELAKVYKASPEFMQLRRLELLEKVIGPNDKLVFVPDGSELSIIMNGTTESVVPVVQTAGE